MSQIENSADILQNVLPVRFELLSQTIYNRLLRSFDNLELEADTSADAEFYRLGNAPATDALTS